VDVAWGPAGKWNELTVPDDTSIIGMEINSEHEEYITSIGFVLRPHSVVDSNILASRKGKSSALALVASVLISMALLVL